MSLQWCEAVIGLCVIAVIVLLRSATSRPLKASSQWARHLPTRRYSTACVFRGRRWLLTTACCLTASALTPRSFVVSLKPTRRWKSVRTAFCCTAAACPRGLLKSPISTPVVPMATCRCRSSKRMDAFVPSLRPTPRCRSWSRQDPCATVWRLARWTATMSFRPLRALPAQP